MKNYFSQLFLCCITWMYASLVLFSLTCLIFFKETLVINQILNYYGLVMLVGAIAGAIWNYFKYFHKLTAAKPHSL